MPVLPSSVTVTRFDALLFWIRNDVVPDVEPAPVTCNLAAGEELPIPICPPELITNLSVAVNGEVVMASAIRKRPLLFELIEY